MKKRSTFVICVLLLFVISLNLIGCDIESGNGTQTEAKTETDTARGGEQNEDGTERSEDQLKDIESGKGTQTEAKTEADTARGGEQNEDGTERSEDQMKDIVSGEVTSPVDLDADSVAVTDFALRLFKASNEEGKNTLISPLSVLCALSMTANGAVGTTREQMESVLGMSPEDLNVFLYAYMRSLPQGEKYKLSLANSIWFKNDGNFEVNGDFLQTNADYYGAEIYKANFDGQTLKEINDWVNRETDGMIPEVLDEIPPEAVMYLINALAFDAEWAVQYSEWDVYNGKFTRENGIETDVEMMRGDDGYYLEDENATGFVKFYNGNKYAFVALLPNEGVSVSDYINSLDGEKLQTILSNQRGNVTLLTSMPKFTVEYDVEMSEILAGMGMSDAFDLAKADFSALGSSSDGNIYISRVIHKTFIEVGELGTRAGAVTVVEMPTESCGPDEVKQVYLDRPFVYMLIDCENNIPFFVGTLMDIEE